MSVRYSAELNPVLCILHYGDVRRTCALHEHFLTSEPDGAARVRVLDNAAPEPYPAAWRRLSENMFWAGALAWTLDALSAEGYTHVWFCNNDIVPVSRPPYLARLAARLRRLEREGRTIGRRVGLLSPAFTANPYHVQMVRHAGGACRHVAYIDGIAPLISLACTRSLGSLDFGDNPYGYGVDIWLSLRAAEAGWDIVVDDAVLFRHHYHTSAKALEGFLSVAGRAEDAYLTARLGRDWRQQLKKLQAIGCNRI